MKMRVEEIPKPCEGLLAVDAPWVPMKKYMPAFDDAFDYWHAVGTGLDATGAERSYAQIHLAEIYRSAQEYNQPEGLASGADREESRCRNLATLALTQLFALRDKASMDIAKIGNFERPHIITFRNNGLQASMHAPSEWADEILGPISGDGFSDQWFVCDESLFVRRLQPAQQNSAVTDHYQRLTGKQMPADWVTYEPYLPTVRF